MGSLYSLLSNPDNSIYTVMLFEGLLVEVPILNHAPIKDQTMESSPSLPDQQVSDSDDLILTKVYQLKKIMKFFSLFSKKDEPSLNKLIQKLDEIENKNNAEKILKEIEKEKINCFASLCKHIEEANKELIMTLDAKKFELEDRIGKLKKYIKEGSEFIEEFSVLTEDFDTIHKSHPVSYTELVHELRLSLTIENTVKRLENVFILLPEQYEIMMKSRFESIEKELLELTKNSLKTLKLAESTLASDQHLSRHNSLSLISPDINLESYLTLSETLLSTIQLLSSFETSKTELLLNFSINEQLQILDESLSKLFKSSEAFKESSYTHLNKLCKHDLNLTLFINESIHLSKATSGQSLFIVNELIEKLTRMLEISNEQNVIFNHFWMKIVEFEQLVDEIDYKLVEMVNSDLRDLSKSVAISDIETKEKLVRFKEEVADIKASGMNDVFCHLSAILRIIESENVIEGIKENVRENNNRDILRSRQEMQEKLGVSMTMISHLETEKKTLEQSNELLKSNLEKASELAEKMIQTCAAKELEISDCRNSVGTISEELVQATQKCSQLEEDVEELSRELRNCKRTIRDKDNEINELKSAASN